MLLAAVNRKHEHTHPVGWEGALMLVSMLPYLRVSSSPKGLNIATQPAEPQFAAPGRTTLRLASRPMLSQPCTCAVCVWVVAKSCGAVPAGSVD